eukprot:68986-Pelagomonas_calceolata.AAC.2
MATPWELLCSDFIRWAMLRSQGAIQPHILAVFQKYATSQTDCKGQPAAQIDAPKINECQPRGVISII